MTAATTPSSYAEARADFHWDPPARFNFARDVIDRWAEDPARLAIRWVDDAGTEKTHTFATLAAAGKQSFAILASDAESCLLDSGHDRHAVGFVHQIRWDGLLGRRHHFIDHLGGFMYAFNGLIRGPNARGHQDG